VHNYDVLPHTHTHTHTYMGISIGIPKVDPCDKARLELGRRPLLPVTKVDLFIGL